MLFEAPGAQAELLELDLDVVPPSTEEPVALPAGGELTVASPLLLPPPGLQALQAGGQEEESQPAVPGCGGHLRGLTAVITTYTALSSCQ